MTGTSRLTPLQQRILELLAPVTPRWTLTGGAALAGFYLHHRTTRDLDLFWHGCDMLGGEVTDVIERLRAVGLHVDVMQRAKGFVRLNATDGAERVLVDLVAEPVAHAEAPLDLPTGRQTIQVDSPHEILVNKLGALLHRAELRDLIDLEALLASGGELERAMHDAARKDSGFSPVTLGWMLQAFPLPKQAALARYDAVATAHLEAFRRDLARRVAALARP